MRYFDGLSFGIYNHIPVCQAWLDREFEYCGLNFCRRGRVWWGIDDAPLVHLTGPVAWWTLGGVNGAAGPRSVYGSPPHEHWEHFYVTFSGPRTAAMVSDGLIPSGPEEPQFRAIGDAEKLARSYFDLFATLEHDGPQSAAGAHRLEGLLLQVLTQAPPAALLSPLEIEIQAWLEEIRRAPEREWDMERQANKLAVSSGHLRRVLTKLAGAPPHRFVLERRLDLAAARLRNSSEALKSIAHGSGFEDVPHFTRLFTRRYGLAPAAYRRETQHLGQQGMSVAG
jgi:AraC-like DNA-binding protein